MDNLLFQHFKDSEDITKNNWQLFRSTSNIYIFVSGT